MFRPKDREKCRQLYDKYYSGRKFHDSLYRDLIYKHLRPGDRILDAGCGRYLRFCREFAPNARVVGIDLDTVFETNNTSAPFAVRGNLNNLPFPPEYFDIVISRSVVEHLDDPRAVFREFFRVLRQGGKVVIITPNRYDYVSVIAALTPHWFHRSVVSKLFHIPEEDVFPTLYRANTLKSMERAMKAAGLSAMELDTINHYPAYLMFSPLLFRLGMIYEKVTSLRLFRTLRGSILCVFQKPCN